MRVPKLHLTCFVAVLALSLASGCAKSDTERNYGNAEDAEKIRQGLVGTGGESGAGPASTAKPTGWATLSGTITINGTPPANPVLRVDKDVSVCKPGGAPVHAHQVVVGPNKGLANVLIFIRKIPDSWLHEDASKPPTEPLVYDQKNCDFLSHVTAVNAKRKLILKNSDPVGHNTNIPGFANPLLSAGGTAEFSFGGKSKSLPLAITCSIHPWMKSYMIPLKNNYFAVTGKDGKFEIKDLPAGVPLEFQVWQEVTSGLNGNITNPNVTWGKKGRFKVTLKPGEDEVLDIDVPATVFR